MESKKNYFWLNGELLRSDSPSITIDNRMFLWGDGFVEPIHAYGTKGKHLNRHLNSLTQNIKTLGMQPPAYLNHNFLDHEIERLLNKNKIFGSAEIRINVFRQADNTHRDKISDEVSISIQARALQADYYPLNQQGLVVDLYDFMRKGITPIAHINGANNLMNVLATQFAQQNNLHECILINDQNRIVETNRSHLFAIKGRTLFTPPINEGATTGVMRDLVLEIAPKVGVDPLDTRPIEPRELLKMDELFTANAIEGVQWIVGLKSKRYFATVSRKISSELNRITFST